MYSSRIQKSVMAAGDQRMGVINELIGAVKLIRFFAWEDRWISRVEEARAKELRWLAKGTWFAFRIMLKRPAASSADDVSVQRASTWCC